MKCKVHSFVVHLFLLGSSSSTMSMSVTVKKYVSESIARHTNNVIKVRQSACLYDINNILLN